jgi:predicted transcriptional regulator of viral defense system
MENGTLGKSSRSRERIGNLLREVGEIFDVLRAGEVLNLPTQEASKILSRWTKQGWLKRVRRGVYVSVPVDAPSERALEDGRILIPKFFAPAYLGGWSAAEHWDLTEQIFTDVCVLTQKPVARQKILLHGVPFFLAHIGEKSFFGTKTVWRGETKILVSDIEKTILDILGNPHLGGGAVHMVECFREALKHKDFKASRLIEYSMRVNNGGVFKRLGFLSDTLLGGGHEMTRTCAGNLTRGNAKLDPRGPTDKLITKWRLFVPAHFLKELCV